MRKRWHVSVSWQFPRRMSRYGSVKTGHLQAVGRDARGRERYRYHARWREVRDESKYGKMLLFGKLLPKIRARVQEDLSRRGLPPEKVLAAIVRLSIRRTAHGWTTALTVSQPKSPEEQKKR